MRRILLFLWWTALLLVPGLILMNGRGLFRVFHDMFKQIGPGGTVATKKLRPPGLPVSLVRTQALRRRAGCQDVGEGWDDVHAFTRSTKQFPILFIDILRLNLSSIPAIYRKKNAAVDLSWRAAAGSDIFAQHLVKESHARVTDCSPDVHPA